MDSFIFAYSIGRYVNHCIDHHQYNGVVEHPNGDIMAYVVGRSDGKNEEDLHGHITSLTVTPKYRRLGIATKLLKFVEERSQRNNMNYVDLFVRRENSSAISLYKSCGYKFHKIHRRMYQQIHDAFAESFATDGSMTHTVSEPYCSNVVLDRPGISIFTMINNLGTKLFQSVTDKAGDLGDRFEVEFSYLSRNVTVDLNAIVTEAISLSGYIKVAIVILCILLILVIIRLSAFGLRCLLFKAKEWIKDLRPPPQVILMMPTEDGDFKRASTVYTDQQTKRILEKLKLNPIAELENGRRNKPDRPLLQD